MKLRLMDRLPCTEDPSIKIEMGQVVSGLSKDLEYVRTTGKKGILRWDLLLEPQIVGEKATQPRSAPELGCSVFVAGVSRRELEGEELAGS